MLLFRGGLNSDKELFHAFDPTTGLARFEDRSTWMLQDLEEQLPTLAFEDGPQHNISNGSILFSTNVKVQLRSSSGLASFASCLDK